MNTGDRRRLRPEGSHGREITGRKGRIEGAVRFQHIARVAHPAIPPECVKYHPASERAMPRPATPAARPADRTLKQGMRHGFRWLIASDPAIGRAAAEAGPPPFDLREPGFPTLLRAIIAQQVSAAAARSIWTRVEADIVPLTATEFLRRDEPALRAFGLSRQKIAYSQNLATGIARGTLDLDRVHRATDDEALKALVEVKGIGRWTGEVYLIFALGRADVWPAADLALAAMVQRLRALDDRPTPAKMRDLADNWRPWRSVAARFLWHCYRAMP
ncbi:MAG: DNA-3-methyladenine glycosylase 2 family protein [Alphaproteobacteria bacterium]|nr:DNA-3-methyladenine glycosylase 2 family protein [Alphaproteobacteria bacterium]